MEGREDDPLPGGWQPQNKGRYMEGREDEILPTGWIPKCRLICEPTYKIFTFQSTKAQILPEEAPSSTARPRVWMVNCQNLVNAAALAFVLVFCQISRFLPHVPKLWQEVPSDPSWFNVIQKLLLQPAVLLETAGIFFIRLNPSENI